MKLLGSLHIVQKPFIQISFYPIILYTEINFWMYRDTAIYSCIRLYTAVYGCIRLYTAVYTINILYDPIVPCSFSFFINSNPTLKISRGKLLVMIIFCIYILRVLVVHLFLVKYVKNR